MLRKRIIDKKSICAPAAAERARYVTSSLDMLFAKSKKLDISLTRYVTPKAIIIKNGGNIPAVQNMII